MRGPHDDFLAFWSLWGWSPNCACYSVSFPLDCIRPSSSAFACLDCPSWLLVKGRPGYWFCWHLLVTQGRLLDLQGLLSASPVLKTGTASLCRKISPCLWWSRLGFYLEDFVFHAFGQETHWPLLSTVFCTLLTTLFLSDWMFLLIISVATLTKL